MTLRLGLIGAGIGQSRMPRLQRHLGWLCGIDVAYELIDVKGCTAPDFDEAVQFAIDAGFAGVNVTHPFKQCAWERFAQPSSAGPGAFNTLTFGPDGVLGFNTDCSGFISAFRRRLGTAAPGSVLLLGAGGVGCAAAFALSRLGAREILIYDACLQQAQQLAVALAPQVTCIVSSLAEMYARAPGVDGLANCTPVGMHAHAGTPLPNEFIGTQRWAFDAVYTPAQTQFLRRCQDVGVTSIAGYDLWIHQGLDAFEIFTGVKLALDEALSAETKSWLE